MSKITIIYDNYASWEKDYLNELFSVLDFDIIYIEKEILNNKLDNEDKIINKNILIFSSNNYLYSEILNIVLRINPLIIVHLSDEYGTKPEYTHLAPYTKFLFHQYHYNHYPYQYYNNIIQIPLAYMSGMFRDKSFNYTLKPIKDRKYKWSFIGNMKQDRKESIDKLSTKFNENFVSSNIPTSEIFEIYNNSIFVPNGRGNIVLDCSRIYEAILSGSIPILVCSELEFNETFYYNNNIPPFLFEKSWDDAVLRCEELLYKVEELEIISSKNYEWLQTRIKFLQTIILSIL